MDDAKVMEIQQWMLKARHDVESARLLLAGDPKILDTSVYHCQQTAEKALKAYLTLQDSPFMKAHDLTVLVKQCMDVDASFEVLVEISEILTPYATAFRYPGDVLEPDLLDAEEALVSAEKVFGFVLEKLPDTIWGRL